MASCHLPLGFQPLKKYCSVIAKISMCHTLDERKSRHVLMLFIVYALETHLPSTVVQSLVNTVISAILLLRFSL